MGPLILLAAAHPIAEARARIVAALARPGARDPAAAAVRESLRHALASLAEAPPGPMPVAPPSRRLAALTPPNLRPGTRAAAPPYRLPVNGTVVAGFGERSSNGWRRRGLLLAPAPAARVIAPAAGRIAYAGPFGSYGRILILDHGHGWTTLLAGLAGVGVDVGDRVAQGQPIARVARTDPRLTIELRHHGRPVDVAAMAIG